jgi:hypothetical protein
MAPLKTAARTPENQLTAVTGNLVENLLDLYERVPVGTREVAKDWYVGANLHANKLAQQYGQPIEGVSGAIAALSPQKGWFENLDMARRVLDVMANPGTFTDDMVRLTDRVVSEKDAPALAEAKSGKPFAELSPKAKAIWVRAKSETEQPKAYALYDPRGNELGMVTTKSGAPANLRWGSFSEIAKAVSVLENPSIENISQQMGGAHKVRNFYNNIVDPMEVSPSARLAGGGQPGNTTIDTHAVAASTWSPMSSTSPEVGQAFGGTGAASSAATGIRGTYPIYADAYRDAGRQAGIMPREMQSITWEAVKGLFTPEMKRDKKLTADIERIWKESSAGVITPQQARDRVFERAGGIQAPDWARERGITNMGAVLAPMVGAGLLFGGTEEAQAGPFGTAADLISRGFPEGTAQRIASGELPMDQASRMARAAEQGFDTSRRLVHTTYQDVPAFDFSRLGENTIPNAADEKLAETARLGAFFADKSLGKEMAGRVSVPVYVPPPEKKFYSLDDLADFVFHEGGGPNARETLLRRGSRVVDFDDEEFGGVSTVALDPTNIRSVNAAFDPANRNSANLLASMGGAGLLGAAALAPGEAQAAPERAPAVAPRSTRPSLMDMATLPTDLLTRFGEVTARDIGGLFAGAAQGPEAYERVSSERSIPISPLAERVAAGTDQAIGAGVGALLDYQPPIGPSGTDLLGMAAEGYQRIPEQYREPLLRTGMGLLGAASVFPGARAVGRAVSDRIPKRKKRSTAQ